ncbi:MAG TPA: tetratricopeptide repeat protein [Candidatus Sulfotelmatobacter sp.]|nr:tetratricopeptide repeat protein [Candidatus Sulfotelmatobacter sp.]
MRSRYVPILILATAAASLWAQGSLENPGEDIPSLIATRQLDSAEKIIVSRLASEPRDAVLITYLAEVRLNQGRPEEALRLADEAEQIGGPMALRSHVAGLAESAQGHLAPAEKDFRRAIELDPKFVPAHYFLARLLYTRNRFDEAIEESKAVIALSPDFVRAYENLGLAYEGKDDAKQAEEWYREAVRRNAESSSKTEWPPLDYATLLIRQDRIDEARPYLDQALTINPNNAQTHFQMGILLEKAKEPQRSLDELRVAIKLDPKLAGALYRAARVCQKMGRTEESQRYFDEYKKLSEAKP